MSKTYTEADINAIIKRHAANHQKHLTEIDRLREELHYCNGTCELAMKHRDEAEALNVELLTRLRWALPHVISEGDDTLATMIRETIAKAEEKK